MVEVNTLPCNRHPDVRRSANRSHAFRSPEVKQRQPTRFSPTWRKTFGHRSGPPQRIAGKHTAVATGRTQLQGRAAGYENGKVDFATLLDAQRQIRQARQSQLKAQADAQMRLAEAEKLLGEDI